jgi:hypothetical protein
MIYQKNTNLPTECIYMSHVILDTGSCISVYGVNQLVFESETQCAVCEAQIKSAYKM